MEENEGLERTTSERQMIGRITPRWRQSNGARERAEVKEPSQIIVRTVVTNRGMRRLKRRQRGYESLYKEAG